MALLDPFSCSTVVCCSGTHSDYALREGNTSVLPSEQCWKSKSVVPMFNSCFGMQDALSPHSPATNQVVPFGSRAGGNADMMWGDPYSSSRTGTLEGRQL